MSFYQNAPSAQNHQLKKSCALMCPLIASSVALFPLKQKQKTCNDVITLGNWRLGNQEFFQNERFPRLLNLIVSRFQQAKERHKVGQHGFNMVCSEAPIRIYHGGTIWYPHLPNKSSGTSHSCTSAHPLLRWGSPAHTMVARITPVTKKHHVGAEPIHLLPFTSLQLQKAFES